LHGRRGLNIFSIVGEMDLDDALSSRDHIKAKLKAAISDDISDWPSALVTVARR
jgi:regulator of protease activity HflC (stomatin/prohibitin superfamily)